MKIYVFEVSASCAVQTAESNEKYPSEFGMQCDLSLYHRVSAVENNTLRN